MKKVAIPSKGGMIDDHFGHCEKFIIFSLSDDNEIVESVEFKGPESCGCKSDLAVDLAAVGVNVLLAAGIGQGAINKIKQAGIEVFSGFKGETNNVLTQWLSGSQGNFTVCPPHDNDGHNCSHE